MDEPDFKVDETGATRLDADDDGPTTSAIAHHAAAISRPDVNTVANSAWANNSSFRHPYAVAGASSHSPEIVAADLHCEKDALRMHLNGKHVDLESNPDTIITVGDSGSMSDADYSDKAAIVSRPGDVGTSSALRIHAGPAHTVGDAKAGAKEKTRLGGFWGMFKKGKQGGDSSAAVPAAVVVNTDATVGDEDIDGGAGGNGLIKPSNAAILAIGGAAIGDLPQRRNSRGEDVMIVSSIPPFTPVRYTIMPTLMQTPAGLHRKVNINAFKVLPFTLRGDYYGFYSTFIAQGATLQINIDGRIAETITRLVHSQQYTIDMMDEAHSEVLQLLYDNIFKKFVRVHHRDLINIM
ncbi:hypothetical protein GGI03_001941 [Coemansia sp. RSA 2337]|nr:hypothetical protein H4S03_001908 [Coemansia sp. S3946]KAJ2069755.1 hypothetical protein GGH13_004406 [Coemansia sp. S155-1]KAJ2466742.1 hypothetical protein GGI03_001941 [Coemansia sp. RSA 2337]